MQKLNSTINTVIVLSIIFGILTIAGAGDRGNQLSESACYLRGGLSTVIGLVLGLAKSFTIGW